MSIGIIGAGSLGSSIARLLAKSGISATISNNRGPESLASLVQELGPSIQAGTVEDAAKSHIVFVALRWVDLEGALGRLPQWNGRIVIDSTNAVAFIDPASDEGKDPVNPLGAFGLKAIDLGGKHSVELFREFVPGARVVRAFNHLGAAALSDPAVSLGKRVLFYSGDDADAKAEVRGLINQTGLVPVDLGPLAVGDSLTSPPFGPFSFANFIKI